MRRKIRVCNISWLLCLFKVSVFWRKTCSRENKINIKIHWRNNWNYARSLTWFHFFAFRLYFLLTVFPPFFLLLFSACLSFSLFSENGNSKSSSIWFSPDISSGSVTSISKTDFVISLKTKSFDSDVIFLSNSCFWDELSIFSSVSSSASASPAYTSLTTISPHFPSSPSPTFPASPRTISLSSTTQIKFSTP